MSLFEAVLVMMIAVPMIQQGVRLAESYIRQQAGVQESRLLTQVVTAASTYALRDGLQDFISNQIGVTRIFRLRQDDFANMDAWVSTGPVRTALRRDIQVIFHARGSEELIVLAHAFTLDGENARPYMPRGGIGIGLVGSVVLAEDQNMWLRGPGLNYPLDVLQAQATTQGIDHPPVVGDQLAIAVLRMDQHVLPYLHREQKPGLPDKATQMQTDLHMGGNNIIGAGEVLAEQVISNIIISEQAKVTDQIVAKKIVTESCTGCGVPQTPKGKPTHE